MGYALLGIGCLIVLVVAATAIEAHRHATRKPAKARR